MFIIVFVIIGYLDVKYGVYDKEISLNNQYNPELQKLVKEKQDTKRAKYWI
jgi:hypothetical protein